MSASDETKTIYGIGICCKEGALVYGQRSGDQPSKAVRLV